MLEQHGIEFRYREYTREPLAVEEIESILAMLDVGPAAVLRRNDRSYKELGLQGDESDRKLIDLMARYPTLLQRPIGVLSGRAILGRPPERLLEL